jgi:hypothetical protein
MSPPDTGAGFQHDKVQRYFVFRYPSPNHWIDFFRTYYGPTLETFATLDEQGKEALANDLRELANRYNRSGDGTMVVPSEYLEVVITRR